MALLLVLPLVQGSANIVVTITLTINLVYMMANNRDTEMIKLVKQDKLDKPALLEILLNHVVKRQVLGRNSRVRLKNSLGECRMIQRGLMLVTH